MYAYRNNAEQVIGPTDVSTYGRNQKAWSQGRDRNNREEFLHVGTYGVLVL